VSTPPFRVLPVLDDDNRFFWTSGEDGALRFLRCGGCGYFLHPPIPRCPRCGGRDVAPAAVDGRAEVLSFTINHHPWDGGTEPYAIAVVGFPEQDDLRLTTNVVGCPPDAVRIGMPVRVRFEHHDDVWVPVFVPAGDGEDGEVAEDAGDASS
jgi:uncharacterized OB-fold protein